MNEESKKNKNQNIFDELDKAEEELITTLKSLDDENTESAKPKTRYSCPMDNCQYSTSKKGLMSKKTALHFRDEHGIKAREMTPGMFKFTKMVVEI